MAHCTLAALYREGWGGVEMDDKKAKYHCELAAMAGYGEARFNLGVYERDANNNQRAVKHWMIAAAEGHDISMKILRRGVELGHVLKDDYEKTLRVYIDSLKEMKSESRDNAVAAHAWARERGIGT